MRPNPRGTGEQLGDLGAFPFLTKFVGTQLRAAGGVVVRRFVVAGGGGTVLPGDSVSDPVFIRAAAHGGSYLRGFRGSRVQNSVARVRHHAEFARPNADALPRGRASHRSAGGNLLARRWIPRMAFAEQDGFVCGVWGVAGGDGRAGNLVPGP